MDSKPVLVSLIELFPQIDYRLLKATAIEHHEDVNAAVGFIVNEVLPTLYGLSGSFCSTHDTQEVSNQVGFSGNTIIRKQRFEACQQDSLSSGACVANVSSSSPSSNKKPEENVRDHTIDNQHSKLPSILENKPNSIARDSWVDISRLGPSRILVECTDTLSSDTSELYHSKCSSVNENRMELTEHGAEALDATSNESCCVVEDKCNTSANSRIIDHGVSISQPVHILDGDILQNCDRDAKNCETTSVTEVESAINLSEPLKHPVAVRQASSTGQDMVAIVRELDHILQQAKQAKDMHAGEVYGEKAILATEARQFQTRLLSLLNEKNKAFSITNELCEILKTRIAAAKDDLATTQGKNEKENLLQLAFKEQEALMDTIVQDSKKLQQEAEENTKLREFLMDHGRFVDTLQGELTVIMEDLLVLKKIVDEQAPIKGTMVLKTYGASSSLSSSSSSSSSSSRSSSLIYKSSSSTTLSKKSKDSKEEEYSKKKEQECCIDTTFSGKLSNYADNQSLALDDDWELLRNDISRSTTPS